MANPSKAKGTGGETELKRALEGRHIVVHRTQAGETYDLRRHGVGVIEALATRPDHGQWLVTVDLDTFAALVNAFDEVAGIEGLEEGELHIEVKRYARFALHSIWKKKFGGDK